MRMKVGDEECMMGYTHAARYETVNFERGCMPEIDVASGKALHHSKTRGNGWTAHHAPSTLAPGHLAALRARTVW